MNKGTETRNAILREGMDVARTEGLEALSIGRLADRVGMSKSGLFAHFKAKEALQLAVLDFAASDYIEGVVQPALQAPRGEPRLRVMLERWIAWGGAGQEEGGCVFLQAAAEFDDRPGPVRERVARYQREWSAALARATSIAVEVGHFHPDVDPEQFSFEMYALIMSYHFHARLLADAHSLERLRAGFERLLDSARADA